MERRLRDYDGRLGDVPITGHPPPERSIGGVEAFDVAMGRVRYALRRSRRAAYVDRSLIDCWCAELPVVDGRFPTCRAVGGIHCDQAAPHCDVDAAPIQGLTPTTW